MLSPLTPAAPLPWLTRAAPSPLPPSFPLRAGLGSLQWGWGKPEGAWLFGRPLLGGASPQDICQLWGERRAPEGFWGRAPAHRIFSGQWAGMGVHKNPKWVGGKRKGSRTPRSPAPTPSPSVARAARGHGSLDVCCQPGWKWLEKRARSLLRCLSLSLWYPGEPLAAACDILRDATINFLLIKVG